VGACGFKDEWVEWDINRTKPKPEHVAACIFALTWFSILFCGGSGLIGWSVWGEGVNIGGFIFGTVCIYASPLILWGIFAEKKRRLLYWAGISFAWVTLFTWAISFVH